jgi:hypothetical protein
MHEVTQYHSGSAGALDYGTVGTDKSLLTNRFPIAIPLSDYMTCITIPDPPDLPIRVLVAWIGNDAVVVGQVSQAG